LKPYWGKPAVRNFRGGAGNTKLTGASPKRLMDIGYPACESAVRLLSTRRPPFAAHTAACLAGASPALGVDCMPM
jgi:hypothetical protein